MLKRTLLIACMSLIAGEAGAISRYTTTSMSCSAVKAAVNRDGAAILRYPSSRNPSLVLYDRYVSGKQFCKLDEYADTHSVPAKDTKSCVVRRCVPIEFDIDDRR